jgi:hypothetical protein
VDTPCAVVLTLPARPGRRAARPAGPGEALDAYARQADELARMVEDWQAANRRYARALTAALGELHVALDEIAADLTGSGGNGGAA